MLQEITLRGHRAALEPLRESHAAALWQAAQSPEIFEFYPRNMASLSDIEAFVAEALEGQNRGFNLPFVVRDLASNQVVGSTRFMDYSAANRSVEIGGTWLSSALWRTRINTECKWLLLGHGFETLQMLRIFLKTDARNLRSQRAIERLGAQYEGTLRSNMILPDDFRRDSMYYSILDGEWPAVKARLEGFLG